MQAQDTELKFYFIHHFSGALNRADNHRIEKRETEKKIEWIASMRDAQNYFKFYSTMFFVSPVHVTSHLDVFFSLVFFWLSYFVTFSNCLTWFRNVTFSSVDTDSPTAQFGRRIHIEWTICQQDAWPSPQKSVRLIFDIQQTAMPWTILWLSAIQRAKSDFDHVRANEKKKKKNWDEDGREEEKKNKRENVILDLFRHVFYSRRSFASGFGLFLRLLCVNHLFSALIKIFRYHLNWSAAVVVESKIYYSNVIKESSFGECGIESIWFLRFFFHLLFPSSKLALRLHYVGMVIGKIFVGFQLAGVCATAME